MSKSIFVRSLSIVLSILVVMLCFQGTPAAHAGMAEGAEFITGSDAGQNITTANIVYMGTYPQNRSAEQSAGEGRVLYNGQYFDVKPIAWRVLESNTDGYKFLSDKTIDTRVFDEGNDNNWNDSDIRAWLNNITAARGAQFSDFNPANGTYYPEADGGFMGNFSEEEQDSFVKTTHDNTRKDQVVAGSSSEYIWLLDYAETETSLPYLAGDSAYRTAAPTDYDKAKNPPDALTTKSYMLRAPGGTAESHNISMVTTLETFNGGIYPGVAGGNWGSSPDPAVQAEGAGSGYRTPSLRPAFNISSGSILFTSDAENGKPQSYGDTLTGWVPSSSNEKKLTLKTDRFRDFSVPTDEISVPPLSRISLDYSGAALGENNYISCAIKADIDGSMHYYGKLEKVETSASGVVSFNLPATLNHGDYTISLFEEVNSRNKLDISLLVK